MTEQAATLNVENNQPLDRHDERDTMPRQRGGGALKFIYATGSRPLDGYTIKRGIGAGGFGEVYFATSDAGKEVALKRIQRNLEVELRGVRQCLNLKHTNLIALYDIKYDDQGEGWVVMEYVSGESLTDVVDRNPNGMPLEDVHRWFKAIASGVEYLHDHGIVHRDLKPGNIFTDEDIVKIGDYGLSKFISCSRRSGQTESVGTFHYMAPEIGKGVYGKEIDIYALGIILCEMLTGRVPFDGESSQEIIMKHLTAAPDLDGVAEPYRGIIAKALEKDPEQRFRDVGEMVAAFEPARVNGSAHAADPPVRIMSASDAAANGRASHTSAASHTSDEPMYIDDDGNTSDMSFGPVQHRPGAKRSLHRSPQSAVQTAAHSAVATEEPIAKAVRSGWSRSVGWWQESHFSNPVKVILLVGAVFLTVMLSEVLVPLGVFLGILYLIYFGIRSLVLSLNGSPTSGSTAVSNTASAINAAPNTAPRYTRFNSRVRWAADTRESLALRPYSVRFTELFGSLLMAALVCGVLCLVMVVVGDKPLTGSVDTWAFYTWLTLTSVFGTWTLLLLGKFWENGAGEQMRRRFALLVGGLGLGLVAYVGTQVLLIDPHDTMTPHSMQVGATPSSMYSAEGDPELPAYLAWFAGLLVILRWWRQVDPLRSTRLSVWATGLSVLWAWILHMIWPFPQPWGFMLAATISIAAQLSAPWISPQSTPVARRNYMEA